MLRYDRVKLGKYLKAKRMEADLSQGEVAKHLGYSSPQFVSNIERGASVIPIATLGRMVRLYNANPADVEKIILVSQEKILLEDLRSYKLPKAKARAQNSRRL